MNPDYQTGRLRFSDGYDAFYRYWPGTRGAVLYVHGIQSHGLWFEGSAARLAHEGYAVMLGDRRGSGKNTRERGHVTNYRRWLADLAELTDHLARLTGKQRVHLLGVSWGGKLAAAFARRSAQRVGSMTLIAPGMYPVVDVRRAVKWRIALAALTNSPKPFAIPLNDPRLFTANVDRQNFIGSDALGLTSVTGRFLCHSRLLDHHARVYDHRFTFPIKLFLAGHDRIIDNRRTLQLFRSWHAPVKQLICYKDANHTLEFEPDPTEYFNNLVEWINNANQDPN